ncbi:DNA-binding response regulator [Pseudoalteromonas luteoviolacea B = ATCC 29581]|nr:DNA-binding response regulator [Pseudoalteromonas luteoviolacea B = ATCC 29581]
MIILLVEDNRQLAATTIDFLANEGIEVDYASTVSAAITISARQYYDAIVLDLGLPDGNGFDLAKHFASTHTTCPLLFLTAQNDLDNKLKAFELGALDYLTKPFELAELAMRIKILGRKQRKLIGNEFKLDSLCVDLSLRCAFRASRPITLSPQQWQLLELLMDHSPAPVDKHQIVQTIWPDSDFTNDMYKTLVTRLRRNLTYDGEQELVHTIRGLGIALHD